MIVLDEPDRPQPSLDRERERGMATVVGRLRPCPILGYKFVLLGHNTIRGAAGASILNAETLLAQGQLTNVERGARSAEQNERQGAKASR